MPCIVLNHTYVQRENVKTDMVLIAENVRSFRTALTSLQMEKDELRSTKDRSLGVLTLI